MEYVLRLWQYSMDSHAVRKHEPINQYDHRAWGTYIYLDGLVQNKRNSSALAMELRPSCINPST